ncbi:unnamed protein product [Ixodes persulcatus]
MGVACSSRTRLIRTASLLSSGRIWLHGRSQVEFLFAEIRSELKRPRLLRRHDECIENKLRDAFWFFTRDRTGKAKLAKPPPCRGTTVVHVKSRLRTTSRFRDLGNSATM